MHRFSTILKTAIEYSGMSRNEICEACNILPAALSKYLTARSHPRHDILKRLIDVLPVTEAKSLYYAHAMDSLPVEIEEYLNITMKDDIDTTRGIILNEDPSEYTAEDRVTLPHELETAFQYLRKKAIESPTVATSVIVQYRILKGVDVTKIQF